MTTPEGKSVGKDPLKGEISICLNRINMAKTIGCVSLEASWWTTLDRKFYDHEIRTVERAFEGLGDADDRV